MQIHKWNTELSICDELYFVELIDKGPSVIIRLEDGASRNYEVLLENCGPYVVADEDLLTRYWCIKDVAIGWTFTVSHSPLALFFSDVLEADSLTHYVVSTMDTCIEVLSEYVPEVRIV